MTEISVSAFRVYCHPCHALFISPCAYTATNWRQVRFKPMLLMGKNVWYVLALVPPSFYIWPSVLHAAAPPDLSACVPIKHLSSVCIYCLNSRGRVSAVAPVSSCLKGQKYIGGYIENNNSLLRCYATFSLSVVSFEIKYPARFCCPCKIWLKYQALQLSETQL